LVTFHRPGFGDAFTGNEDGAFVGFVHFVHDLHQGFAFVFVFGVWVEESELVSAWGIEV
jgi:hypothetical protein